MDVRHPIAVVQARMGSSRLPGKVMEPVGARPLVHHVVDRVRRARSLAGVVVATTDRPADALLRAYCAQHDIPIFAGSEHDVLDRYRGAAEAYDADPVVRITSDCPFADPQVIDRLVALYGSSAYDYAAVATGAAGLFLDEGRFPIGLDAECISRHALDCAWREAISPADREHVTPYIWGQPDRFSIVHLRADRDLYEIRLTVDTPADLELTRRLYAEVYDEDEPFALEDVVAVLERRPDLRELNASVDFSGRYLEAWQDRTPTKGAP